MRGDPAPACWNQNNYRNPVKRDNDSFPLTNVSAILGPIGKEFEHSVNKQIFCVKSIDRIVKILGTGEQYPCCETQCILVQFLPLRTALARSLVNKVSGGSKGDGCPKVHSISCSFLENLAKSYVGAPLEGWHPLLQGILGPPLKGGTGARGSLFSEVPCAGGRSL